MEFPRVSSFAATTTFGLSFGVPNPLAPVATLLGNKAADVAIAKLAGVVKDSNASAARTHASESDAKAAFQRQARALFDVNNWSSLSGFENATFELRDSGGQKTTRKFAQVGDFVRIRLPLNIDPDWVRIESAEVTSSRAALTVRPSYNPTQAPVRPQITDHFFTKQATNTFSVEQRGSQVVAAVRGRNERANLGAESKGGAARTRNAIATAAAWGVDLGSSKTSGLQQHQWNVFSERLINR